jgi:hypothetical protein
MARKVRIQYPGATYHGMNRGGRREATFEDDEARERLLQTLSQACQKIGWQVRSELLEQVDARPGPSQLGEAVQEAVAAQAERLVVRGLRRMRWTQSKTSW